MARQPLDFQKLRDGTRTVAKLKGLPRGVKPKECYRPLACDDDEVPAVLERQQA